MTKCKVTCTISLFFSREKEWNLKRFHTFRELKSEFSFPFTHFENEKWNENAPRSRSRSEMSTKFSRILEKRDSRRLNATIIIIGRVEGFENGMVAIRRDWQRVWGDPLNIRVFGLIGCWEREIDKMANEVGQANLGSVRIVKVSRNQEKLPNFYSRIQQKVIPEPIFFMTKCKVTCTISLFFLEKRSEI